MSKQLTLQSSIVYFGLKKEVGLHIQTRSHWFYISSARKDTNLKSLCDMCNKLVTEYHRLKISDVQINNLFSFLLTYLDLQMTV